MVKNKINNKIYFGQTTNKKGFRGRYANNYPKHCSNKHIKASIEKYGWNNFEVVEVFDVAYSLEELNDLEEMYVKMWETHDRSYGYNKKFGGSNHKGQECSEETKKKLSEAGKGRKITDEHKKHLSESLKGKPKSEQQKRKIREKREEINEKISKTQKNKIPKKKVYCMTNDTIYNSAVEAAEILGLDNTAIYRCCHGKAKQTKGYKFRFV